MVIVALNQAHTLVIVPTPMPHIAEVAIKQILVPVGIRPLVVTRHVVTIHTRGLPVESVAL